MRFSLPVIVASLCLGLVAQSSAQSQQLLSFASIHQNGTLLPSTRLDQIAELLKDPKQDGVALLTEGIRLCGFSIWSEDRAKLQDPLSDGLKLAITDKEIEGFLELYRRGDRVLITNLANMFDPIYKELGGTQSVTTAFAQIYSGIMFTFNKPTKQNLSSFLQALARTHDEVNDSPITGTSYLDPIQSLILIRMVSEDLRFVIRKGGSTPMLFANTSPLFFQQEAPGWAEDSFAGGITGLVGELLDSVGGTAKKINNGIGKANALMAISKFLMTYKFLKGTVTVEAPGQPLVRTKDSSPGEKRTVVAKFFIDGTGATDWIKDNRKMFNVIGLDPDVPKSGALKGVEVSWDIKQNTKYASKQLIQAVTGTGDLSKQKTNDAGESRVTFEGKPRIPAIDPRKSMPISKEVPMVIAPQVKNVEMQQDIVDAITGAIGLKEGPSGLLTPIMEMLYRAKWESPTPFTLKVKDWTAGDIIGQCSIEIEGNGSFYTRYENYKASINRKIEFTNSEMVATGGTEVPTIDPALLKSLPEAQRKQIEAGMKQAELLSKNRSFQTSKPGVVTMSVNDSLFKDLDMSACTEERVKEQETWKGFFTSENPPSGFRLDSFMFTVTVDLDKKIAILTVSAVAPGKHVVMPITGGQSVNEDAMFLPFFNIEFLDPKQKEGFEIPLKETPLRDQAGTNYYGTLKVPFKFGPKSMFGGNVLISYSVTRKNPPKK